MFAERMSQLLEGGLPEEEATEFLTGLRFESLTSDMLCQAARLLRQRMLPIEYPLPLLDTCGTGGDHQSTINLSTAAALVVAAAGVKVAKHGNRAVSSSSGSSDVLQALGCSADLPAQEVVRCLDEVNIGFCFAPRFHPQLKAMAPLRKKLGFPTIFNLLGPLCNPARVNLHILGVGKRAMLRPLAEALLQLGAERAAVVHGEPGLDEISLQGATSVCLIERGKINELSWTPDDFGLPVSSLASIYCRDAHDSAAHIINILMNREPAGANWVLANAGAGLWIAGQVKTLREGVQRAAEVVRSGLAMRTLQQLQTLNQESVRPATV